MKYRKGYKYQLAEDLVVKVKIFPKKNIKTEYINLTTKGKLTLKHGYCSDGPSGPTIDTKSFMRGAFAHDGLYQLMRMELLPQSYRLEADQELKIICLEDGMWKIRVWWVIKGLKIGGASAADPRNRKEVLMAP